MTPYIMTLDPVTYLIHWPDPYLSLCGRQPLGFRVVTKDTVECVCGRLKSPSRLNAVTVDNLALSPETEHTPVSF